MLATSSGEEHAVTLADGELGLLRQALSDAMASVASARTREAYGRLLAGLPTPAFEGCPDGEVP